MPSPANESRCIWKENSDRGLRDDNQDRAVSISPGEAGLIRRKGVLMVVCDGVGAELGGKRAAEIAVDTTLDAYYADQSIDPERTLLAAVASANTAVKKEADQRHMPNMATTLVASVVFKNKLYIAHVGDSRAYLLREGRLARITQDHSSLGDMITAGTLTSTETRRVSRRRAITRSLGTAKSTPDINTRDLRWGDRVLLCTDGLYEALDDSQIERVLNQNSSPERATAALIRSAMSGNSSDNITASVLNYGEAPKTIGAFPINPRWLAVSAAVLIVGLVAFFVVRAMNSAGSNNGDTNGAVAGDVIAVETVAPVNTDTAIVAAPVATTGPAGEVLPDAPIVAPPTVDPVATTASAPAAAAPAGPLPTPTLGRPQTATPQRLGQTQTNTTNTAGNNRPATQATARAQTAGPAVASASGAIKSLVPNGVSVYVNNRFGIELLSTGFEQWGNPLAGNGCEFYNDLAPVNQFKLTLRITNTGSDELRNLKPQFFANSGVPVSTCHDGGGALPNIPAGESRVVRLLGYLNKDQNLTSLTLNAEGRSERACFAANKMVGC